MPSLTHLPEQLTIVQRPLRLLTYGDFGRRKTTLAGTFPDSLVIDTNGGLDSIALTGRLPLVWEPEGSDDLTALYYWIRDEVRKADESEWPIKTIVLDTVDNLCRQLMSEITQDAVGSKEERGKAVSLRMQWVPEQGDYYANQNQLFQFLGAIRMLRKHIVLTSSERETTDKRGRTVTGPNVSPGMALVLCDFVSVVGRQVILDEVTDEDLAEDAELRPGATDTLYPGVGVMFTTESNSRATKSRYRSIKPYVVDPTFDKLNTAITAEFEAAQAAQATNQKRK